MIRTYDVTFENKRVSVDADVAPFEREKGKPPVLRVRLYSMREHGTVVPQNHKGEPHKDESGKEHHIAFEGWSAPRRLALMEIVRRAEQARLGT